MVNLLRGSKKIRCTDNSIKDFRLSAQLPLFHEHCDTIRSSEEAKANKKVLSTVFWNIPQKLKVYLRCVEFWVSPPLLFLDTY